ncbi:phospholipase [Clostridium niameyense]|uniref:Phospholipase n=1 Tax=Clostridium niameyense TaxID=1622073 RepID=A0A6M0R9N1_9CLOT|nr:patatin-like phospholipase family protein [Clostridium niameyense]NEZ46971.1 phospholipase [Clostridium niameyense]
MKADAVFQGGGVKAIGFIGAIYRLEEENIIWKRLAGTSAGAIVASLLAVGYTGRELKEIIYNIDYKKLEEKSLLQNIPLVGKPLELLIEKGILSTDSIEKYLIYLYKKKDKLKFKDISINGQSRLKIIATDVTNKKLLVLPDDIKDYGIDPMEFEISKAVRMSISIPFVFTPVKLNYMGQDVYIVDGGLTSNYPIWIFDVESVPRWPTLGFKLKKSKEKIICGKADFLSYVYDVADTVIECYDETYLNDKDKVRTISIPTLGVKSTDFHIDLSKKEDLFNIGYERADKFLKSWNFENYIRKYRR